MTIQISIQYQWFREKMEQAMAAAVLNQNRNVDIRNNVLKSQRVPV